MKNSAVTTFFLFLLAVLITACGSDDAAVTDKDEVASPTTDTAAVEPQPAPKSAYEAGPKFCGKIRPPQIMAAFEFKIKLADVSVAEDYECHYNLDAPGLEMALLIYRMQPIAMYEAYKDSSQKTEDIANLGEEAILLGNAQIDVKLDDERALEVALMLVSTSGQPLPLTEEEMKESLIRFAYLLSVRL